MPRINAKQALNKKYRYAIARARGASPNDALRAIGEKPTNGTYYDNDATVQELMSALLSASSIAQDDVRLELTAEYLNDSRNADLPMVDRHRAREALIKMYGLAEQRLAVSADDKLMDFFLKKDP